MDSIKIECMLYQSKRDFNRFVRSIEDPHLAIIDYSIIKNKLIKADPYHNEPNDYVTGLSIMSSFKNKINSEKKKVTTIVYSFRDLSCDNVSNFKEMVLNQTDRDIIFCLNVLCMGFEPVDEILNQFDSVNFVNND
jgi:hypothetical protein